EIARPGRKPSRKRLRGVAVRSKSLDVDLPERRLDRGNERGEVFLFEPPPDDFDPLARVFDRIDPRAVAAGLFHDLRVVREDRRADAAAQLENRARTKRG